MIRTLLARDLEGVPLFQVGLAVAGLLCAAVAVAGAVWGDPTTGLCLSRPAQGLGHCAWCWAAIALLLAAATPIRKAPRPVAARTR